MDFLELAKKRYSVRKYETKKVEEENLLKILEAGRVAPTGVNKQPIKLIVIQSEEGLSKIKKAANVYGAPLAIIICGDHNTAAVKAFTGNDIVEIDTSIVTDHIMLEATNLGLGSCWICHFDPAIIKDEFNIPENLEPVNILAVGYASGEPQLSDRHDKVRKALKDIVVYETL